MDILFLIFAVISASLVNILSSFFIYKNKVNKNGGVLFNFLLSFAPLICWAIYYAIEQGFEPFVLLYALGFGISFIGAFIFLHFAIQTGPLSITSLLVQMSLVLTVIWGIIFWQTPVNAYTIVGLVLITLSLALCVLRKDKKKFNFKWLLFSLLACIANAGATIIMKTEQIQYENKYGGEMMFFAFVFVVIIGGLMCLIIRKKIELSNLKGSWWIAPLTGLVNFSLNLFVILLAKTSLSPAIIYPCIAIGSLALNIIFSLAFNKEKITVIQYIGLAFGAAAIVFLSL